MGRFEDSLNIQIEVVCSKNPHVRSLSENE